MITRTLFKLSCLLTLVLFFPAQVAASQTLINETVTVDNLSYRAWSMSLNSGDSLSGSIHGSGDINFYILDSGDYADFSAGRSFYYSYRAYKVSSLPSFSFAVPSSGTWYIVLDNQYSLLTSKSVAVTIYLDPYAQSGGSGTDMSAFFIFVGLIILLVVGAAVYSTTSRKKKIGEVPQPPNPQ